MTDYLAQLERQTEVALAMAEELKDGLLELNREMEALLKQQEEQS